MSEEWHELSAFVLQEMAHHAAQFATPITCSNDLQRAQAWGTANYLSLRGGIYLLTNEHVVSEAVGSHLAHLPGHSDDYVLCNTPFLTDGWPVDIALMRLPSNAPNRISLPAAILDAKYSPAENELLFWLGFPGSTAIRHEPITQFNTRYNWFGGKLETLGFPILIQEAPTPIESLRGFDADKHVVLHYPSKAMRIGGQVADMPNPKGMSGSLLWDTKFTDCVSGKGEWSALDARVCGVIWAAYSHPELVVATKIEYIRPTLIQFLREEASYFHWLERGRPLWDASRDWSWAEDEIRTL